MPALIWVNVGEWQWERPRAVVAAPLIN